MNGMVSSKSTDINGYEYIESSQKKLHTIDFEHIAHNPKGVTSTVAYSVSRSVFAEASVSTEASFDSMVADVGIEAKVSEGTTTSDNLSITWSIPANEALLLQAGSKYVRTIGRENYWVRGILVVLLLLVLTSCSIDSDTDKVEKDLTEQTFNTESIEPSNNDLLNDQVENISLSEKFVPPNFKINAFDVTMDEENNCLNLSITYTLNDELYDILSSNVDCFMSVEFPTELVDILKTTQTDKLKCEVPFDKQLTYSIEWIVTCEDIDKLEDRYCK